MNTDPDIKVRSVVIEDMDFIISLIPRLTEFGPPSWRDAAQMTKRDIELLTDSILNQPPGTAIFIAEDHRSVRLGFIHLKTGTDYYKTAPHGHISDIIVAPEGEGRGIGRLLMDKGEEWARANDYGWLTLSVFAQNFHAREVYKKLGYGEDIMKYVKELT